MNLGALIAISLVLGAAAWLFFVWTVKSGQYDDPEGPKYRMLDDDDPTDGSNSGTGGAGGGGRSQAGSRSTAAGSSRRSRR